MRASTNPTMALLLILILVSHSLAGDGSEGGATGDSGSSGVPGSPGDSCGPAVPGRPAMVARLARPRPFPAEHVGSIPCKDPITGFDFSPLGVSFGLLDELFVVDSDNSQIFILPGSLDRLDVFSECPGEIAGCRFIDVEVGDNGDLFVSEQSGGAVLTLDRWGEVASYTEIGEGIAGLGPGPAGKLYAALGFPGIVRIADLNTQAESIDCLLSEEGENSYPVDCLVVADDRVLVTDASMKKVLVLSPVGDVLGRLHGFEFESPFGLAAIGDHVLVSDIELGLVAVFTAGGKFIGVFGEGLLEAPAFMDIRADGTVCIADTEGMTIEVFRIGKPKAE